MDSSIDSKILAQAMNVANEGIVISDFNYPDYPIVFANEGFEKMTGYTKKEILFRNCRFLQGNDRHQLALEVIRKAIKEKRSCRVELRNYKKDGTLFWNELSLAPLVTDGKVTHYVGIQKDITRQKKIEEALYSQAKQDPLTLLYNRRGFFTEARKTILLCKRHTLNVTIVMIDIDDFKKINDTFGHTAGDEVLVAFAHLLKQSQRQADITVRYGGDEFAILMIEDEPQTYEKWRPRFEAMLATFNASYKLPCHLSFSSGSSRILYYDFKSLLAALKEADEAMYEVKKLKRLAISSLRI